MKRYLGSIISSYAAIVTTVFAICPVVFVPIILVSVEIGTAVILSVFCIICSLIWSIYIKQVSRDLYSWGFFSLDNVLVRTWFMPSIALVYSKCRSCGIAYYTHGVFNSSLGSKHFYIFLSYDFFDESYRERINMFKTTQTQLKVCFRQDLFEYLVRVLPSKLATCLKHDYQKYINKTSH